ncbi:hypothetical protein AHY58_000182 [Salmonella enterica subsp. enterica]|nr:hypothetical protein [Salmonella enterica]EBR9917556.1 hypothetical protein [Salmonella enterica subsp. enterica serovar Richmond]ECA9679778.1 hypothetical protein [Salmonella enterica subsp. enterica serovar Mikawasima]ECF2556431.1 hypothetical protein [Salmonella enterica subsp. enterica serovar Ahuza]ECH0881722.1 hypothetical protein [Salmonella enterica subsp. enterica serovar Potsdam]EDN8394545.1 hypothetical protein [Salmonella enterica subsp. enterica serovar Hvittingfoss]
MEKKYPLKDLNEELAKSGMLERMRTIIGFAIKEGLSVSETLDIINREVGLIDAEIELYNKKARENIIRRELGLGESAILTGKHYAKVFNLFSVPPQD